MMLKTAARITLLGTMLVFLGSQARADTYDWAFSITVTDAGPNGQDLFVDASGVLTTTNKEADGALLVTGIMGSRTTNWYMGTFLSPPQTAQIVGLVPPGVITQYPPDNLIYPHSSTVLDSLGIGYQLNCFYCGSGGIVQVAGNNGSYYELVGSGLSGSGSFTLTPTPEPKSFALFAVAALVALLYWVRLHTRQKQL